MTIRMGSNSNACQAPTYTYSIIVRGPLLSVFTMNFTCSLKDDDLGLYPAIAWESISGTSCFDSHFIEKPIRYSQTVAKKNLQFHHQRLADINQGDNVIVVSLPGFKVIVEQFLQWHRKTFTVCTL